MKRLVESIGQVRENRFLVLAKRSTLSLDRVYDKMDKDLDLMYFTLVDDRRFDQLMASEFFATDLHESLNGALRPTLVLRM